jgi:hypothetical protein
LKKYSIKLLLTIGLAIQPVSCFLLNAQIPGHADYDTKNICNSANDILKRRYFIVFDAGFSFLSGNNQIINAAGTGYGFSLNGKYFLLRNIGVAGKVAFDLDGITSNQTEYYSGTFDIIQFLGGICLMPNSKKSSIKFSFISLAGFILENNPVYETGGGSYTSNINTGNGHGIGYYEGIELTNIKHKLNLNFGIGYLGTIVTYPNYTSSSSGFNQSTNKWIGGTDSMKELLYSNILEFYLGIGLKH